MTNNMKYTTGALKNPKDLRDISIAQVQAPMLVPKKHITDISMLPVLDQKQLGACVGHAFATVMAYQNFKETGKYEYLSPRFIYALAKRVDGYAGQGTFPRVAGSVASKNGCSSDSFVKNDTTLGHQEYITVIDTKEITNNALIYKSGGYATVAIEPQAIKQAIYRNGMITMSIGCGDINQFTIKPGTSNGSHSVAFYGYEDLDGDTILYFRNSWTDKWGEKGNGKISMKDFKGFMYDAIVLTDIPNKIIEEARAKYKYFTEKEVVGLKPDFVKLLDTLRGNCGFPFKINSGLRTKTENDALKDSVSDSSHLSGNAADIAITDSAKRFKIVSEALKLGINRIGVGETYIHLDIDTTKPANVIWHYYK